MIIVNQTNIRGKSKKIFDNNLHLLRGSALQLSLDDLS